MTGRAIDIERHPIDDPEYAKSCKARLDAAGALVLDGFFDRDTIAELATEYAPRQHEAFYTASTHNVYLTPADPDLSAGHPFNRQVSSSKGVLADDQIPATSPLRMIYGDDSFRRFLCVVLGIEQIFPYADALSSINVHFATEGQELGWHFDNSSFAVTMLLQQALAGGVFEYVAGVRDADAGDMAFDRVAAVLDDHRTVERLDFAPGDLVLFRGSNALHRVTPTEGDLTRMLVVFAFNDEQGAGLSASAQNTFYGRTA